MERERERETYIYIYSNFRNINFWKYFLRVTPTMKHYSDIVSVWHSVWKCIIYNYGIFILAFYLTFFLAYTLTFILSDIQSPWPPKFWPILMSSSLEANLIFLHFSSSMNHHQAFLIYPPIYPAMSIHLSIHPTIYPTTIILLYFYMEWWSTPTSTSTHLHLHQ